MKTKPRILNISVRPVSKGHEARVHEIIEIIEHGQRPQVKEVILASVVAKNPSKAKRQANVLLNNMNASQGK